MKTSYCRVVVASLVLSTSALAGQGRPEKHLSKAPHWKSALHATLLPILAVAGMRTSDVEIKADRTREPIREAIEQPALEASQIRHLTPEEASKYGLSREQNEELKSLGLSREQIVQVNWLSVFVGGMTEAHFADIRELARQGKIDEAFVQEDEPSEEDREQAANQRWGEFIQVSNGERVDVVVHPSWSRDGRTGQYMEIFTGGAVGQGFAWSDWVSLGKPGHDTVRGNFTVQEMDKNHRSITYGNSPMFQYLRLGSTWGTHETPHETELACAASMGCVRSSHENSLRLWALASRVGESNMHFHILEDGQDYAGHMPAGIPPFYRFGKWNQDYFWTGGTAFPERMSPAEKSALENERLRRAAAQGLKPGEAPSAPGSAKKKGGGFWSRVFGNDD